MEHTCVDELAEQCRIQARIVEKLMLRLKIQFPTSFITFIFGFIFEHGMCHLIIRGFLDCSLYGYSKKDESFFLYVLLHYLWTHGCVFKYFLLLNALIAFMIFEYAWMLMSLWKRYRIWRSRFFVHMLYRSTINKYKYFLSYYLC